MEKQDLIRPIDAAIKETTLRLVGCLNLPIVDLEAKGGVYGKTLSGGQLRPTAACELVIDSVPFYLIIDKFREWQTVGKSISSTWVGVLTYSGCFQPSNLNEKEFIASLEVKDLYDYSADTGHAENLILEFVQFASSVIGPDSYIPYSLFELESRDVLSGYFFYENYEPLIKNTDSLSNHLIHTGRIRTWLKNTI